MNILKIFLVGLVASILGGFNAHATVVDVYAQGNSSTGGIGAVTGIDVNIGDQLVMVTGTDDCWSAGGGNRTSNADGLVGNAGSCQPTQSFGLYEQAGVLAPYGSLMGKIDAGDFFFVGTAFDQVMTMAGALTLYYWDSNSFDNSGYVSVNIALNPGQQDIAEPGILGILGLGLGLLLLRRRI